MHTPCFEKPFMGEKQYLKGVEDICMFSYAPPRDKGSLYENIVKLKEKGYSREILLQFSNYK